jgi:uncharacterized protein with PIN domain
MGATVEGHEILETLRHKIYQIRPELRQGGGLEYHSNMQTQNCMVVSFYRPGEAGLHSIRLPDNYYRCAECGGVFEKALTDEEAKAQLGQEFPGIPVDECSIMCDDCYKKMFGG